MVASESSRNTPSTARWGVSTTGQSTVAGTGRAVGPADPVVVRFPPVAAGGAPLVPAGSAGRGTESTVLSRWISPTRSYWVWPFWPMSPVTFTVRA